MKSVHISDGKGHIKTFYDQRLPDVSSAEATPEPQAQSARCALATGSVPVSEAEELLSEWRAARDEAYRQRDVLKTQSSSCADDAQIEGEMWDRCICDLQQLVEAAKKRQPAQNVKGET